MAADQAAGLRRRQTARPARCLHLVSDSPDPARRLVQALSRQGLNTLLVDAHGRHFGDAARSLFDWRQQLARRQLHLHAMPGGEGWHAPGVVAAELSPLAARYDCLVFDHGSEGAGAAAQPSAGHVLALEVGWASLKAAYRLLKTRSHHGSADEVVLFGEAAACARLEAACRQFLDVAHAQKIGSLAHEADAFAALAVRMADEETGPRAVA